MGDGPGTDLLVAEIDGTWTVVQSIHDSEVGACSKLTAVSFPSCIAGTWCNDDSENGTHHPLS